MRCSDTDDNLNDFICGDPVTPENNAGTSTALPATSACPAVCGNDLTESNEQCDGSDDPVCPGACQVNCTCPGLPAFTGVLDAVQGGTASSGGTGSGLMTAVLDTTINEVEFDVTFSGLSADETVSHIHGPAALGVGGGVIYVLPLGSPKQGTIVLSDPPDGGQAYPVDEQIRDLIAGLWYVNVHSLNFPAGEIRGPAVDQRKMSQLFGPYVRVSTLTTRFEKSISDLGFLR